MSAHTPGPWAVSKNAPLIFGRPQEPGLEPLGFIYGPSFEDRSAVGQRAKADAVLCAAAPELLEALLGVLRVADRVTDEFDAARAALAKATGAAS